MFASGIHKIGGYIGAKIHSKHETELRCCNKSVRLSKDGSEALGQTLT